MYQTFTPAGHQTARAPLLQPASVTDFLATARYPSSIRHLCYLSIIIAFTGVSHSIVFTQHTHQFSVCFRTGWVKIMRLVYCGGGERKQWLGVEPEVGSSKIDTSKTIEALVVVLVRAKTSNDKGPRGIATMQWCHGAKGMLNIVD